MENILELLAEKATAVVAATAKAPHMRTATALASATWLPFSSGALGQFPYYWQSPSDLSFNALTYDWINANLKASATPIQQATGSNFTNLFISALGSISYQLSTADQAALTAAAANVTNQQGALLLAWKNAYGSLPVEAGKQSIDLVIHQICTTWASPATTLAAMQASTDLAALLNTMPLAGASILPALQNYLAALNAAAPLENAESRNMGLLSAALGALQGPSATNGGLATSSQLYLPAYTVLTPLQDILNGLGAASSTITMKLQVQALDATHVRVTLENQSTFTINADDLYSVATASDQNFFRTMLAQATTPVQLTLTFNGVTIATFGPVAFEPADALYWYWVQPILDSILHGTQDVTGFKFSPTPAIDFTATGPFAFLNAVAISNYPQVDMTLAVPSGSPLPENFDATIQSSAFLGTSLVDGNPNPAAQLKTTFDTATQTLKISQQPASTASAKVSTAGLESRAWVHAVQATYPAA